MIDPADISALQDAIREQEGVASKHLGTFLVHEVAVGTNKTVWEGGVEVFAVYGHPKATQAYAWSEPTTGTQRGCFVVLHVPPVGSPNAAVRASLLDAQRLKP